MSQLFFKFNNTAQLLNTLLSASSLFFLVFNPAALLTPLYGHLNHLIDSQGRLFSFVCFLACSTIARIQQLIDFEFCFLPSRCQQSIADFADARKFLSICDFQSDATLTSTTKTSEAQNYRTLFTLETF